VEEGKKVNYIKLAFPTVEGKKALLKQIVVLQSIKDMKVI